MHAGDFKPASWFAKVARTVQGLRPDIAVLGGDVVVDASRPIGDLAAFKDVVAKLGKVYVMGNHDLVDRPQDIRKAIEGWGYACIENKTVRFEKDGRHFDLSGIADPWFGDPRPVPRASRKVPHVTVSHEPDMLMDMVAGDTDLMLAGHTHAGQVRLPLVGALWPIPAKLGRAVDQGRKVVNGIPVIVSNGLGESDGRLRVFAPPQIVCVDIGI
jgi:predicted MPP superfamily phosphohydrolase